MQKSIDFRPVILAGGSGTRFWPRSRRARAKQVLALDGERSMIQQTVERLKPLAGLENTWIITNEYLAQEIADQLPGLPAGQIVQEPVARNTAPACGLAAFLIEGSGIRAGTDLGEIDMRSIAPTLAKYLGASLPSADLPPLEIF